VKLIRKKTFVFATILCVVTVILTMSITSTYYNYHEINLFTTVVLPAIVSAVSTAIPVYIGIVIGVPKEFDNAMNAIEKKLKKSSTAKRAIKFLELSEKLFGDDQVVEQITGFFKEARGLVSSPEARNFFTNATKLMKELGTEKANDTTGEIELPDKPREVKTK